MSKLMTPQLGDRVRCKITGLVGIMIGKTEYLFGCVRCQVQPEKLTKSGGHPDSVHLDLDQVEVVKFGVVTGIAPKAAAVTGGPARPTDGPRNPER